MNRLNWTLVFVSLAAVGLLVCQSAAFAQEADLPVAPMPSSVTPVAFSLAASTTPVVTPAAPCMTCGEGCGCGCGCGCDRHWYAGVEALWLDPVGAQKITLSGDDHVFSSTEDSRMIISPRITLGWQGDCWGIEARYWQMGQDTNVNMYAYLDRDTGAGYYSQTQFAAETFDLEVTRLFTYGCTNFQWAGGVRYGQFHQGVELAAAESDPPYAGFAASQLNFDGVGLTTALTGIRPVGCGNFNLFYSLRLSWLWDNNASGYAIDGDLDPSTDKSDASLFIGEIEAGGQWNMALKCIPANAFIRASFEYQYWNVTDRDFYGPRSVPEGMTDTGKGHVNLVGFGIGAGITY